MKRRYGFGMLAVMCMAAIAAVTARAVDYVAATIRSFSRWAVDFVWFEIAPALRVSSPLAYVGPSSIHALRHEAGVSRIAADRKI